MYPAVLNERRSVNKPRRRVRAENPAASPRECMRCPFISFKSSSSAEVHVDAKNFMLLQLDSAEVEAAVVIDIRLI
jgi:hypothetical protein